MILRAIFLVLMLSNSVLSSTWADHPIGKGDASPMVLIPGGSFIQGSIKKSARLDERPKRKVYIETFLIDKHEVTYGQYKEFLAATGHKTPFNVFGQESVFETKDIDELPVVQVTWNDAEDYCSWVGKRLPTEAEWEKAPRGTDERTFPWGEEPPNPSLTNFNQPWENGKALKPVGSYPEGESPYGVQDMAGNVREWVHDWYSEDYYGSAPIQNPRGPETGILKVIRGGSWHSFENDIRSTARNQGGFALKTHGIGFRCARDYSPKAKEQTQVK